MAKTETPGVEHRAPGACLSPAVLGVARDRVAERSEMDADLMGAAGVEVTTQQGMGSLPLDDVDV